MCGGLKELDSLRDCVEGKDCIFLCGYGYVKGKECGFVCVWKGRSVFFVWLWV